MPELHAHPWADTPALRDGVLPGALARPAHHEQVAGPGPEQQRRAAAGGAEPEGPGGAEGDQRDDGLGQLPRHAVAVPGDAVRAVAVEVDPHLREPHAVVHGEHRGHCAQVLRRGRPVVEQPAVGETRFGDDPVVHVHGVPAPRRLLQQAGEEPVRAAAPAGLLVHPGAVVELPPRQAGEGRVDLGRVAVEQ